ncbi:RDD family protein [Neisseria musculi]|uniref:RDD family protein n=1 Tax=Neisseria musculi TaxID=1815583 RepID=A0A7H1MEV4_9NEIS|nr:RDD family protein [Neisseria musculi]QNT60169.1 RDD family protein [Neisseria musculi]
MDILDSNPASAGGEIVDVDIASAGSRIAAYLLNTVFTVLVFIPLLYSIVLPLVEHWDEQHPEILSQITWNGPLVAGSLLLLLVYLVVQMWLMSKDGQSFGKRILKIRVLKSNGENPGFWGTVMLREVLFNVIVSIASMIIGYLITLVLKGGTETAELIGNALSQLLWIVCLVMLFNKTKNRRTLQDILADTVVVKLPKR